MYQEKQENAVQCSPRAAPIPYRYKLTSDCAHRIGYSISIDCKLEQVRKANLELSHTVVITTMV